MFINEIREIISLLNDESEEKNDKYLKILINLFSFLTLFYEQWAVLCQIKFFNPKKQEFLSEKCNKFYFIQNLFTLILFLKNFNRNSEINEVIYKRIHEKTMKMEFLGILVEFFVSLIDSSYYSKIFGKPINQRVARFFYVTTGLIKFKELF